MEHVPASKLINQLVKNGNTRLAQKIVSKCFTLIEDQGLSANAQERFTNAVLNVTPVVEVQPRRIGGSVFQVPVQVFAERGNLLAIRWIVQSARARANRGISSKLAAEILDASQNTGGAVKKRESIHKMAEANKAFAHYA